MDDPTFPLTLGVLGALVLGVTVFGMSRVRGWRDRLCVAGVGAAGFVALWLAALRTFQTPGQFWNVNRLAVTVSMVKGYSLYYPPDTGPIQNHIYGPFAAMAYLPAAIARTPTNGVLLASLIAAMWFFIPAAWLICRSSTASWIARFAAIVCFACLVHNSKTLSNPSSWNHADAPALGLAACASAALQFSKRPPAESASPTRIFVLSAIFAVLAIWTKQTTAPIIVALTAWIAAQHGWRIGAKYSAILAVTGAGISVACVFAFGPRGLWFNMFVEPSHHPWQFYPNDHLRALARILRMLAWQCLVPLLILIPAAFMRSPNRAAAWLLPTIVGITMIPTACLGWVKQGGAPNNAAYVTYFLVIAACAAVADCETPRFLAGRAEQVFAGRALIVLLSLNLAWQAYHNEDQIRTRTGIAMRVHDNGAETDFRFERAHPGEAYFPWDALAPLLASGKLYHFDFGVHDRILAGYPPSDAHLHAYLPPNMRLFVIPYYPCQSLDTHTLLPEFREPAPNQELPNCLVLGPAKPPTETR